MNPVPTCPKLEDDFVPNWRMIEKRHLRLEYQRKTWLSSCQEIVFVCGYPLMFQHQWFHCIFFGKFGSKVNLTVLGGSFYQPTFKSKWVGETDYYLPGSHMPAEALQRTASFLPGWSLLACLAQLLRPKSRP